MLRTFFASVVLLSAVACGIVPDEETKLGDGKRCDNDAECQSGVCTRDALCAPSLCDCPGDSCPAKGARSEDCDSGWVCVADTNVVEHVGEFFGAGNDNDGYCQLPCSSSCPEHYLCKGDFCSVEVGWADPVPSVSWDGAVTGTLTGKSAETMVKVEAGQTVTLTASASSPVGSAIESYAWTLVDDQGMQTMSMGASVDLMIAPQGSFTRAELTVTDAKMSGGLLYVIFEACGGDSEPCP